MAQVMRGLILGSPGVAGSPAICDLFGSGSPLTSTDPIVAGAQIGSTYRDYTTPALWFKTALPNTWQQITIP
jgi:hypothetical protein